FFRARDTKPLFEYYFDNLSMIPDEKQYLVIEGDSFVGALDEAFVSEYGQVGVKFVEAGRCWKIEQIYENKVYVKGEEDPTGAVPSWVGDEIPVPLEVAAEVGGLRRRYGEALSSGGEEEFLRGLSESYSADPEVLSDALKEVAEQVGEGLPVPSDEVITLEKWDRFVVIQAAFGHMVNRLLARVLAHLISESIGQSVAVHQDPYRIVMEADVSANTVAKVLKELPDAELRQLAEKSVERSGLFKRRLIHAGKKCGAIAKDADYASVSISGLIEAMRDTPVYEEAMDMVFHDDFDVESASEVLMKIKEGAIRVEIIDHDGLSPVARIGVEEISRRGDVVSPQRLRALLRQSTMTRLLDTFMVAVCSDCWSYLELKKVADLDGLTKCPNCGKQAIGISGESYESVFSLAMKARSRTTFTGKKQRILENIKRSSQLRAEYGHAFDLILAGRGIRLSDAEAIAEKRKRDGTDLIDSVIEGERDALRRRYFAGTS
ncbi:MAG TPA: hypothetical protein VEJ36_09085, partial [Nitrososphaerales archaeon]|nr:hypothetical protein [Nitrososphaerales archaeon]